ncbi:c-type cytochrome [Variovorax soli]|uniref:Cytochrome c5 n=1 Tax=Variovorax soli TaxID=376815 RepID=A0ABU1NBK4_9BURK|nr:c-type cytochrome [Variovorax soli]MDR6535723.1 cytochrome c5 [Variovorax soli]
MSDDAHYQATEDAHTGPIKNPKQLLLAVFFSFIAPILIIVGLVSYVTSANRPSGEAKGAGMALYGVSKDARDREVFERLKKVGSIEIRDADRPLATGETVFKAQCVACHGSPGIPGAPHFSDAAAWGPRIGQGYATLLDHALHGKGAMPPQGGGDFDDVEIGRAVVYMANAGGAKFPVPDRPTAAGAPGAAATEAAAAPASAPAAKP